MKKQYKFSRRRFLQAMSIGLTGIVSLKLLQAEKGMFLTKSIPASNERIPVIGLGSSRTFNVGNDPIALNNVAEVMRHFFNAGGKLIDSSPMYGSSQPAIGYGLNKLSKINAIFSADKVWTWEHQEGIAQMEQSRKYWKVNTLDLIQIHNLVAWEEHIKTLTTLKQQGKIRYVGVTTSHGRRHSELEEMMKTQPLDFVQFSYNILDREVEQRLLPLAKKRGIAVITNRPFQRGDLIDELIGKPLPIWAKSIGCNTWSQFLLKFVVSHPAVTCAIPATSQVEHVKENMLAGVGILPDNKMRTRMIEYVEKII